MGDATIENVQFQIPQLNRCFLKRFDIGTCQNETSFVWVTFIHVHMHAFIYCTINGFIYIYFYLYKIPLNQNLSEKFVLQ